MTVLSLVPAVPAMAADSILMTTSIPSNEIEFEIEPMGYQEDQITPYADMYTCGWNQMAVTTTVMSASGTVGTVYAGEGVTVLNCRLNYATIEYSGSGGAKQGQVPLSSLKYADGRYPETDLGIVATNCTTYYSPAGIHTAGSLSSGEYVAILSKSSGWYYVEYNISGGMRKRAYVPEHCINYIRGTALGWHYHDESGTNLNITTTYRVYAGPNPSSYPDIGYIDYRDNGNVTGYRTFTDANGNRMYYISYPTSAGLKYGYIRY